MSKKLPFSLIYLSKEIKKEHFGISYLRLFKTKRNNNKKTKKKSKIKKKMGRKISLIPPSPKSRFEDKEHPCLFERLTQQINFPKAIQVH